MFDGSACVPDGTGNDLTVTMTTPMSGAVYTGTTFPISIPMAATVTVASGSAAVQSVTFSDNSSTLFVDTTAPYSFTWT